MLVYIVALSPNIFVLLSSAVCQGRVIYRIVSKNLEELKGLSNIKPSSTWNGLNYPEYITELNLVETGGGARG